MVIFPLFIVTIIYLNMFSCLRFLLWETIFFSLKLRKWCKCLISFLDGWGLFTLTGKESSFMDYILILGTPFCPLARFLYLGLSHPPPFTLNSGLNVSWRGKYHIRVVEMGFFLHT